MRYTVIILLLLISTPVFAQKADAVSLKAAVAEFNTALVKRDTIALKRLLDDKLKYGHSNTWVQTKKEMIADLFNGKLSYTIIDQGPAELTIDGNTGLVRATAKIKVEMNAYPQNFQLNILQVWVYKKGWKLIGRQSVRI